MCIVWKKNVLNCMDGERLEHWHSILNQLKLFLYIKQVYVSCRVKLPRKFNLNCLIRKFKELNFILVHYVYSVAAFMNNQIFRW